MMLKEIDRFYKVLLWKVVRGPRRTSGWVTPPFLLAMPDLPVGKRVRTKRLADMCPNQGMHFHALVAVPRNSGLREDLVEHIHQNEEQYRGIHGKIEKIEVRPLDFKNKQDDCILRDVKWRRFADNEILWRTKGSDL
jgi:hypothetical protein